MAEARFDEPTRATGLRQSDPAFVMGREDFLFGRPFTPYQFANERDQFTYNRGWTFEKLDKDSALGLLSASDYPI